MWGFAESTPDRDFLGVSRSVSGRAWRARLDGAGEAAALTMSQRHGLDEILARVLAGRGVDAEKAAAFLVPSLRGDLPDPATLTDMEAAAARLADAVERGEAVAIFGDYDVDGATSSALLHRALADLGLTPRIYIPDRIFEGYGPNAGAIDTLVDEGASLIVCVDCGSTSFEALDHARERGVDVLVIDHHQMGPSLPAAVAVVNPNRQDCLSGQGHLAAVGVTFLAAVGLQRELRRRGFFAARKEPDLLGLVNLVALGTVCDMVPLKGVNRAFVIKGLIGMRGGGYPGLSALAAVSRLKGPLDAGRLGFLLGPRINAGGRIGNASLGAQLLTTREPAEAERIAGILDQLNAERQAIEVEAVSEATAEVEALIASGREPAVLVVSRPEWHPGVVGLVASRLKERFERPALAIALGENGFGTGSGRSISGVDLGEAIRAAVEAGILAKGGGHAMAAGLTVSQHRLGELQAFLEERLAGQVEEGRRDRSLLIDSAISDAGAHVDFIQSLEKVGPFGSGHPSPIFALPAHRLNYVEVVGSGHVRLTVSGGQGPGLKAMAFRAAETPLGELLLASRGRPLHLAGTLCLDHWGGTPRAQLRIIDAATPTDRL
ncbi:single-stranded-DNA-specific exonuclease [Faunimonas pinastri]|uniref:Single-stranded-DNA-specific exonuclease RecJ n=1 Tax=Faunimonas pinastri TaxID=1855383 RepID=A0A1H9C9A5_9HYPH|nr:single-stranded-DNA-specific exonuclease RecJ [Faunimonas pinastri]SEP97736.1 single-stranded-DNA-specific exonuclease [Faunimonas pinastri]